MNKFFLSIREMPWGQGKRITKMRYSVIYDDLVAQWAVVDTRAAGLVITIHGDRHSAEASAEREEKNLARPRKRCAWKCRRH